ERHGGREVGEEALVNLVAGAKGADVDDVVIIFDRLIGRDVRDRDVDRVEIQLLFLARERAGGDYGKHKRADAETVAHGNLQGESQKVLQFRRAGVRDRRGPWGGQTLSYSSSSSSSQSNSRECRR